MLALILSFLSGPIVNKVLDYLDEKQKTQQGKDQLATQITIETIKDALAQKQLQASLAQAEIGSKLLAIPRFCIEMAVATIIIAWVVSAIDPAAKLGPIDPNLLQVVSIVLAGMFTLGAIDKIKN